VAEGAVDVLSSTVRIHRTVLLPPWYGSLASLRLSSLLVVSTSPRPSPPPVGSTSSRPVLPAGTPPTLQHLLLCPWRHCRSIWRRSQGFQPRIPMLWRGRGARHKKREPGGRMAMEIARWKFTESVG
jgi:hypothetical protein